MARVLIVGGAGYVGGALTSRLASTPHEIRVYDSLLYEESYRKPVPFEHGDVRDWSRLQPHLDWAEVVVWLAALVGDGACAMEPELTREINQNSVRRLADSFTGRILFTSTCSVYGAQEGELVEDSPINPLSLYAETKAKAEESLRDRNAMVFRLGTLYGVGDEFSRIRLDLVVNILTVKAALYNRISVFGGDQYRPLLHVRDIAAVLEKNITTPHTGVFNVHSENVRIADLAERFQAHFPGLEVLRTEMKFQDSRNYRVSSRKAVDGFGFNPACSIDDGIAELKRLLIERRLKNIALPRHSNQKYLKGFLERPASPLGYELSSGI